MNAFILTFTPTQSGNCVETCPKEAIDEINASSTIDEDCIKVCPRMIGL